jgi:hypothetical protein
VAGPTRRTALRAGALAGVLPSTASAVRADELAVSDLFIRGSRLLVTPAEQTTAPGLPCRLDTDPAGAPVNPHLLVVGELAGPGLDRAVQLTAPLRGESLAAGVRCRATKNIGPRADAFPRPPTDCALDRGGRASSASPRSSFGDPEGPQGERG